MALDFFKIVETFLKNPIRLHRVSSCNLTFLSTRTRPAAVQVSGSHDIVFSHDPLGNVPPRKSSPTRQKNLERTQRHKEAEEGAAAEAAVSGPTEDSASPYSRATPILSEC